MGAVTDFGQPVRLADGSFGLVVRIHDEQIGVQVPGEEEIRWIAKDSIDVRGDPQHAGPARCESKNGDAACETDAAFRVFWPGASPLDMCALCALRAQQVSAAMSFHLHIEPLYPRQL